MQVGSAMKDLSALTNGGAELVQSKWFIGVIKKDVDCGGERGRSWSNDCDCDSACGDDGVCGGDLSGQSVEYSTLIQAVNTVEDHIDAGTLQHLADVFNVCHPQARNLSASQLLGVYESRLLKRLQHNGNDEGGDARSRESKCVSRSRIHHLGAQMATQAATITLASLRIDSTSIWSEMMAALLSHQVTRYENFDRFYEDDLVPPLFHWEEFLTTGV